MNKARVPVASPEYDTLLRRAGALCIDHVVLSIACGLVAAPFFAVAAVTSVLTKQFAFTRFAWFLPFVLISVAVPGYFVVAHLKFGGTVGKRLLGLTLKRIDGTPPDLGVLLKRYAWMLVAGLATCLVYADVLLEWYSLGGPWPVLVLDAVLVGWLVFEVLRALENPRRRMIHDYMAGTVVVFGGYQDAEQSSSR